MSGPNTALRAHEEVWYPMQRDMVSREDLERELREIEAQAPGQIEGVFGPASLTWRSIERGRFFSALAALSSYSSPILTSLRRSPSTPHIGRLCWPISSDIQMSPLRSCLARWIKPSGPPAICISGTARSKASYRRLSARLPRALTIGPTMSRRCVGSMRR